MKTREVYSTFWAAFLLLTLVACLTPVQAETVTMNLALSPANEVPPITNLNATGNFQLTLEVTRDAAGAITGGKVTVVGVVNFPGAITITGFHIHQGASTANGNVIFDSGISPGNPLAMATGVGPITSRELSSTDAAAVVARLTTLRNGPTGFYLNLHTTANPGGAIRAQLTRWDELRGNTITMSPAQEVPPVTGLNATATAAIVLNLTRFATNTPQSGHTIAFNIAYDGFPANTTFTGLHIHEGAAGANGSVVFDTGISPAFPLVSATGKGTINIPVSISLTASADAAKLAALARLLSNPTGFYVNLHTTVNASGALRGQLTGLSDGVPALIQSNTYFLSTSNNGTNIAVLAAGVDLMSTAVINGQPVTFQPDLNTGAVNVNIPATLLANPGVLQLQIRSGGGVLSNPLNIVVAALTSVNSVNPVTVEAASYGTAVSPESLAAAFGTRLASQPVAPPTNIPAFPTVLDGTSVYFNGIIAPLFFVSGGQVNYVIPDGVLPGPAQTIIVAKDGTVSRGQIMVNNTAPAIFTVLANGRGAPAAVGITSDGRTFFPVSNLDGTPIELAAGNFLVLFGTGLHFSSGGVTGAIAMAGGVTTTALYAGWGNLIGLDQVNIQIPQAMAGKGEMDMVLTIDGKTTNPVRIKIK